MAAVEVAIPGAVNQACGEVVRSILNGWSRVALPEEIQGMLSAASRAPGLEASRVRQVLVGADRETNYSLLTHVYRGKRRVSGRSLAYIGGRNALSGGLYRRSAIEHGASGLAGEFGHLMIDPQGAKCWSGREGCVETRVGLAHLYSVCMGSPETESFRRLGSGHQTMLNELLAGAKEAVTLCNHVRLMVLSQFRSVLVLETIGPPKPVPWLCADGVGKRSTGALPADCKGKDRLEGASNRKQNRDRMRWQALRESR